jgi:predicted Zn-ribbon and HTH transcriptional regulator
MKTCIKCGELILPNIGCECTEDAATEKLGWMPAKKPSCPKCGFELRMMSTLWSKCPKCGIRIMSNVDAMPNEKS